MFRGLVEFVIVAENLCTKHIFHRGVRVIRVEARNKFLRAGDKVVWGQDVAGRRELPSLRLDRVLVLGPCSCRESGQETARRHGQDGLDEPHDSRG
jgi:hypothetical protein